MFVEWQRELSRSRAAHGGCMYNEDLVVEISASMKVYGKRQCKGTGKPHRKPEEKGGDCGEHVEGPKTKLMKKQYLRQGSDTKSFPRDRNLNSKREKVDSLDSLDTAGSRLRNCEQQGSPADFFRSKQECHSHHGKQTGLNQANRKQQQSAPRTLFLTKKRFEQGLQSLKGRYSYFCLSVRFYVADLQPCVCLFVPASFNFPLLDYYEVEFLSSMSVHALDKKKIALVRIYEKIREKEVVSLPNLPPSRGTKNSMRVAQRLAPSGHLAPPLKLPKLQLVLTRKEIQEDWIKITGHKYAGKPRKSTLVQRGLGLCTALTCPSSIRYLNDH